MFILDGKPLSADVAFTTGGVQYPANWLRLASPEEREAIGITEVPDPAPYDQRFYWGPDLPKDHAQLVEQWVGQTKATAGSLLAATDWYITRQAETGTPAPQAVLERRAEIRALSNTKETAIEATTTTDELAAYVTSADYGAWEGGTVLVRARNEDGTFVGDDPATPENEAYVEVPISEA